MVITCPHCKFSKEAGELSIPRGGVTATCSNCRQQFRLAPDCPPAPAVSSLASCPACGYAGPFQTGSVSCPGCGVVFAKYLAKVNRQTVQEETLREALFIQEEGPLYRRLAANRQFWIVLIAVLLVVGIRFGHDWKLEKNYLLLPSCWQGEMTFRGKQHPFLLAIQIVEGDKIEGYMDWTETSPLYRLAIRGTRQGNHLLFEDYKFIEGSGQYGLHDKQDVYITENEMTGTAKNGQATLHAVKVALMPEPVMEPARQ